MEDEKSLWGKNGTRPSLSELITVQWQAERGDLDLSKFLLAVYFVRVATLVQRTDDRECLKNYGIKGGDMRVMLALRRSGPPYAKRPTDLFRTLLVTSGAITKKVDRLVEVGYVERLPDPTHNGGFLVHLTKSGLKVVDHRVEYLAKHSLLSAAVDKFTPQELQRGMDFVLRTLSALESSQVNVNDNDEDEDTPRPTKRKKSG